MANYQDNPCKYCHWENSGRNCKSRCTDWQRYSKIAPIDKVAVMRRRKEDERGKNQTNE